ncbi:MAG TPA: ribosome silencing factor [Opitutaceae bacterium]|nr:ribosome silencing factor [Opitutaceae bacterium]
MKSRPPAVPELVRLCCRALADKKAEDIRVLDVSAESSLTDYLVFACGTSQPHLRALRAALDEAIKASGTRLVGVDATEESGWTVIDAFDVMIHLFTPAQREHFGLENLWKDAAEVPLAGLLPAAPKPKAPRKAPPRRRAAAAKAKPAKKKKKR